MLNQVHVPHGEAEIAALLNGRYIPSVMIRESVMRHLENAEQASQKNYTLYREYYDGEHQTMLSARIRAFLNLNNDIEFNVNYCPIVVDALAERLKVTGFDAGDQGEVMWQWWRDSRMDAQQGVVHTGAIRDGDFFEMVEWDNEEGRPCFSFETACADGMGVKVHYSTEKRNKIEYASKRWFADIDRKVRRLNLYLEDHIEKYVSDGSGYEGNWRPYVEDSGYERAEASGVIIPKAIIAPGMMGDCGWTDWKAQDGKPLGVPVVHFKNKDQGYDRGQSELANVIPLQNALNKSLIDLIGAADVSGFPMLVGIGEDWTGIKMGPGQLLNAKNPAASLTRLEASDLKPMIEVKDSFAMEIARVSRTPISYFQSTSQLPAEGSEMQREVGLIAKGEKCNTDFGNAWEDMMKIARRLNNAFGGTKMDEKQRIEAQWAPLQKRDELAHLQSLTLKKQLGVTDEMIWSEMGYDAEQIIKMAARKLKNARVFASAQVPAAGGLPNGDAAPAEEKKTAPAGGPGPIGNRGVPPAAMMEMSKL